MAGRTTPRSRLGLADRFFARQTWRAAPLLPLAVLASMVAAGIVATGIVLRLAFTWLGVRETLAPEQRTTAARAFKDTRPALPAPQHASPQASKFFESTS